MFELLCGFVEQQAQGTRISVQDKEFIADFYKYAVVGMVLDWVKGGMRETPGAADRQAEPPLERQFALAIENFRERRRTRLNRSFTKPAVVISFLSQRRFCLYTRGHRDCIL